MLMHTVQPLVSEGTQSSQLHSYNKMKTLTVENLTDSILSVYGDMSQPSTWNDYVSACVAAFGGHPLGASHSLPVPPQFAARWYAAFGIA